MSKTRPSGQASVWAAGSIVVASMIGTGVYTSLGFQVAEIPSGFAVLFLWMLGGVISLCGALCYAELAAALPRSGGEYHLLSATFHPLVGFLSGWISLSIGFAAPVALSAMAFGAYLAPVLGWASPLPLAFGVVILATVVHLVRLEIGNVFLTLFTVLKVLVILIFIGAAWLLPDPEPVRWMPQPSDLPLLFSGPFAVSLIYVMYAYSGWNAATYIVDEVRDPQRSVPRALIGGTLLVTLLYALIHVAFLRSAPMEAYAGKIEVGLIAGQALFGARGGSTVAVFICLGLVSMISAMTWSGSRVGQRMAEDHPRLRWLGLTTAHGIPWVAITLQSTVAMLLMATSTFESVLVYIQAVLILSSLMTVLGVVWLRRTRPDLSRPVRTLAYPVPVVVFTVTSLLMLVHVVHERPVESAWGIATLIAGAAAYRLCTDVTGGAPPAHRIRQSATDRSGSDYDAGI